MWPMKSAAGAERTASGMRKLLAKLRLEGGAVAPAQHAAQALQEDACGVFSVSLAAPSAEAAAASVSSWWCAALSSW